MTDKLNRGVIFDTATTPAWAKKLFTDLFGLLTWALTETLSGSGVAATPGPGRRYEGLEIRISSDILCY